MAQPESSPLTGPAGAEVRVLTPDDVPRLRLGHQRRANDEVVRRIVATYPNRSVWSPETLEFALVAPWRHRREIAAIEELSAVKHASALLRAAVEQSRRAGDAMALMMEMDQQRPPAFFERAGMRLIEQVITYDLPKVRSVVLPGKLAFAPADPTRPGELAALLRIDHAAFPWLWWNCEQEFRAYAEAPGTELYLGLDGERPVAYFGISIFPGWGHLDRIAVDPAAQGRGYGRQTLAAAINVLHGAGARRIALSTQRANTRSQRLYESFGFLRSPGFDYGLYGTPVPAGIAEPAAAEAVRAEHETTKEADRHRWAVPSATFSS